MLTAVAVGHELVRALSFAGGMTWEILWALILGFLISALVQALVSKQEMRRLLPDDSPRTLVVASGLGAVSTSAAGLAVARSAQAVIVSTATPMTRLDSNFIVFTVGQRPQWRRRPKAYRR